MKQPPTFLTRLRLLGTGRALPERVLSNQDLEAMVDTNDAWIVERTGIRNRRIAAPDEATSHLASRALQRACEDAGVAPDSLDGVILGTSTTDTLFPATACWVQEKLGIRGMFAFDVSAGCSGFLYALELASALLASGRAARIGVIGAEVMSKVVNWEDRTTC
ncbi:MAG: 3-oxoacyl-ACP synthase, partial [Myxococcales bacterium]|nr:3-oxoacyl-ACP synthase [Myxococcales bacterium]